MTENPENQDITAQSQETEQEQTAIQTGPGKGEKVPLEVTQTARHRVYAGLSWDPIIPTSLSERVEYAKHLEEQAAREAAGIEEEDNEEEQEENQPPPQNFDPYEEAKKGATFDLDLSCYIYRPDGSFRSRVTPDGYGMIDSSRKIYHSGDDEDGAGDNEEGQDDERLYVELRDLPEDIGHIVFLVSSKNDFTLTDVRGIECRIVDSASETPLLHQKLDPREADNRFNYAFAAIHRTPQGWMLSNISTYLDDLSLQEMEDTLGKFAMR